MVAEGGLAFKERTVETNYIRLGQEIGRERNLDKLRRELIKIITTAPKETGIQVTTSGREMMGIVKLGGIVGNDGTGQIVFDDSARKDVIEFLGKQNTLKIRQMLAGFISTEGSSNGPKQAIHALGEALETVKEELEIKRRRFLANASHFAETAERMERVVAEKTDREFCREFKITPEELERMREWKVAREGATHTAKQASQRTETSAAMNELAIRTRRFSDFNQMIAEYELRVRSDLTKLEGIASYAEIRTIEKKCYAAAKTIVETMGKLNTNIEKLKVVETPVFTEANALFRLARERLIEEEKPSRITKVGAIGAALLAVAAIGAIVLWQNQSDEAEKRIIVWNKKK